VALSSILQDDFSTGIWRGRRAPGDTAYDLVNLLINDESQPFRRGGSAYVTTSDAGGALFSLKASYYPVPSAQRTIAFSATNHYAVNGTSFATLGHDGGGPYPPPVPSRIAAAGRFTTWPLVLAGPQILGTAYGGSLKSSSYTAGTVAVTNGSTSVTGTGTSWSANVDAGMIMVISGGGNDYYLVKNVASNTSLTLDQPWQGSTGSGLTYSAYVITFINDYTDVFQPVLSTNARPYAAYVGSRLLFAYGTRVAFSSRDDQVLQGASDYHELPGDAFIVGLDGIGDTAYVFTTAGVWSIQNLLLDAVDGFGNVQHTLGPLNKNVICWGDAGIAAWDAGLIVPAVDDVHVLAPDGSSRAISEAIRPLYRSYVKAGYQPGLAAVHRGHYFLPVLNGTTWVDTLVCRLDRGLAWTRWSGHAASVGFASQVGASSRSPKLYAVAGQRVVDLTSTFDPDASNATDADGTTPTVTIITRDYPTGANQPGFAQKLRARYELTDDGNNDDFEDTADGNLGSPWEAWTTDPPVISDGIAFGDASGSGFRDAQRPESVGPDCFCQIELSKHMTTATNEGFGVGARLTAHSGTANGYMLEVAAGAVKIQKGAAFSTIATTFMATTMIDGLRIVATGTSIKGYVRQNGAWSQVVTATDATYSAAGYPGFWIQFGAASSPGVDKVLWGSGTAPPTVTPEFSSDADGGVFVELADRGQQNGGPSGWVESDGSLYQWATVGKRRERIRFRVTLAGACASFVLRSIELLLRPSGRQ
jgi:hypothetical protein